MEGSAAGRPYGQLFGTSSKGSTPEVRVVRAVQTSITALRRVALLPLQSIVGLIGIHALKGSGMITVPSATSAASGCDGRRTPVRVHLHLLRRFELRCDGTRVALPESAQR